MANSIPRSEGQEHGGVWQVDQHVLANLQEGKVRGALTCHAARAQDCALWRLCKQRLAARTITSASKMLRCDAFVTSAHSKGRTWTRRGSSVPMGACPRKYPLRALSCRTSSCTARTRTVAHQTNTLTCGLPANSNVGHALARRQLPDSRA